MDLSESPHSFQAPNDSFSRRSPFAGAAGLLVPGLGQAIRGSIAGAVLVCVGSIMPVLWTAMLLNQRVNDQLLAPKGFPRATIFDGTFLKHLGEIPPIPPQIFGFLGLGLTIWLLGASMAFARAPRPTAHITHRPPSHAD